MAIFSKANEPRFTFQAAGIELLVVQFKAEESISMPFCADLELASEQEIAFDKMIGQSGLLTMESGAVDRHLHGIVERFAQIGVNGRFWLYKAHLVPQFQLLALEQDCRIFQEKSVPDIVKLVLEESHILSNLFDFRLQGKYAPRDYCVQYRESDLAFISRLLEEEGIFYFFEHAKDQHLMVFGDGMVNYQPIAGKPQVIFKPGGSMVSEEEAVIAFELARQVRTGKYSLQEFNYEKPSMDLSADTSDTENKHLEVYDYPGEYLVPNDGKHLAQVRLQQAVKFKEHATGKSVAPRFVPGFTFTLENHDASSLNKEYLLVKVVHEGAQPQVLAEKSAAAGGTRYANEFWAIPSTATFRPERDTRRPAIKGVQTAIVTGPSGEEIYTDDMGRVKVQFHWDRLGRNDDKSSCWVRVSQLWAGAGWGAMFIPRIGQEVIVDFLEGDPDRPIITGRVYNGLQDPPYKLPDDKSKSTIMSRTTPNSKTFNELFMEDKASETRVVLSNAYGHKLTMDEKDQYLCIETRDGNKVTFDDKKKHIEVLTTKNHNILISDEKKKIAVLSTQGHLLEIDDDNQKMTAKTLNGNMLTMDDKSNKIEMAHEVGGHSMVMTDKTVSIVSGGGHSVTLDDGASGEGINLEDKNGNKVLIDSGSGKITMEAQGGIDITTQGDLNIKAANVKVKADMDLKMEAGMNVNSEAGVNYTCKGTMLTAEGSASAELKASGQTKVSGAIVMIN